MLDEDNVIRIVQYQEPPLWMEWGSYLGGVAVFAAFVATGEVFWVGFLTAMLLYWNYRLFHTIKQYVRYVNTNNMKELRFQMLEAALNEHKDGTFQDSNGLTKEQGDEVDEAGPNTEGD